MQNIKIIEPEHMEDFFDSLWQSHEFKLLQKNHPFFLALLEHAKKAPIFLYDLSFPQGKYHLTSHMRLICTRPYDNAYMHDLYYFHEICHCLEFKPSLYGNYSNWKYKIEENELYASIVSEVLIYYMAPSLIGKTFNPLWANKFYSQDIGNALLTVDKFGFFVNQNEQYYLEQSDFDLFSFEDPTLWPKSIQNIIERRKFLRTFNDDSQLSDDEKIIVAYNIPRNKWIEKWENHYKKIDLSLIQLINKEISSSEYLQIMIDNSDEYKRPFFPK
jgi:hypothetical protein